MPLAASYRWQYSANGTSGWTTISGQTASTYVVTAARVGQRVRSQVMMTNAAGTSSWVASNAVGPITAAGQTLRAGTLTNPAVSMRLPPIGDRGFRPFVNAFKQSDGWRNGNWQGGWDEARAAGYIDQNGRVLSVPASGLVCVCLDRMRSESGASGHWRLTWSGSGNVWVNGGQNVTLINPNRIEFDFTANGANNISVQISSRTTDLFNWKLVHQDDWATDDAGQIFRAQFLDEVRNYRCLRFDDWQGVMFSQGLGGLKVTTWASRAQPADEAFYRFVPYEVMFHLCDLVGSDPWICLPTASTNDHFDGAATLFKSLNKPGRPLYVELSSKVWDGAVSSYDWFRDRGREAYGTSGAYTLEASSYHAQRFVRMAQGFRSVWGDDADLQLVIQAHADSPQTAYEWLEAPMWRDRAGTAAFPNLPAYVAPYTLAQVLTVHGQLDGDFGYGKLRALLDDWRANLTQTVMFNRIRDQILTRPYANDPVFSQRSLLDLKAKWAQWRTIANDRGLTLACYEFGNHLNNIGGTSAEDVYTDIASAFSVSSQMADIYAQAFAEARTHFNGPIAFSNLCRVPDHDAVRGLQRYLGDHNLAWQAIETINLANDGPGGRGAGAFVGTAEVAS